MPAVDLSQLPDPAIIAEPDFEAILADTKAMMIAAYPAEQREAVSAALELESGTPERYRPDNSVSRNAVTPADQ